MECDQPKEQSELFKPGSGSSGSIDPTPGDQGSKASDTSESSEEPPKPKPRVKMDPKFRDRVTELKKHAEKEKDDRKLGKQVLWYRPEDWTGDLFAWQEFETPYKRTQANDQGVEAMKDGESPGVTGDIVAAQVMIEVLATLERALRVRHTMRRPRAIAHMLGRKKGHGHELGVFAYNHIEYVTELIKQAAVPL